MKIECVLFDLDGVLVDACEWHYEALNNAMQDIIGIEISREDHINKYNGLPTAVKLRMLGIEEQIALRIEELKQINTFEIIAQRAETMFEKQELHSYLKSQNIKIACVTNSIRTTATAMLRQTGQIEFIDLLVSNGDVQKNKPHSDCYDFAINALGVDPSVCLCVEDSPNGKKAALASKAEFLWEVKNSSEVTLKNYMEYMR